MSAGRLDCGKHLNVRGHSDAHRNKYSQLVPQLPSNIQHRDQAQQSQGGRVVSTNPAIPVRWGVQAQQWSCGRACREESLTPTFRSVDVQ